VDQDILQYRRETVAAFSMQGICVEISPDNGKEGDKEGDKEGHVDGIDVAVDPLSSRPSSPIPDLVDLDMDFSMENIYG